MISLRVRLSNGRAQRDHREQQRREIGARAGRFVAVRALVELAGRLQRGEPGEVAAGRMAENADRVGPHAEFGGAGADDLHRALRVGERRGGLPPVVGQAVDQLEHGVAAVLQPLRGRGAFLPQLDAEIAAAAADQHRAAVGDGWGDRPACAGPRRSRPRRSPRPSPPIFSGPVDAALGPAGGPATSGISSHSCACAAPDRAERGGGGKPGGGAKDGAATGHQSSSASPIRTPGGGRDGEGRLALAGASGGRRAAPRRARRGRAGPPSGRRRSSRPRCR